MKAVDIDATIIDLLEKRAHLLACTGDKQTDCELISRDILTILDLCVTSCARVVYDGQVFDTTKPLYFAFKVKTEPTGGFVSMILSEKEPPEHWDRMLHGGFLWGKLS